MQLLPLDGRRGQWGDSTGDGPACRIYEPSDLGASADRATPQRCADVAGGSCTFPGRCRIRRPIHGGARCKAMIVHVEDRRGAERVSRH